MIVHKYQLVQAVCDLRGHGRGDFGIGCLDYLEELVLIDFDIGCQ